MKLRGAFDPRFQLVYGAVTAAIATSLLLQIHREAVTYQPARVDIRVAPWALLAGLIVGMAVGRYRLRALRKVLAEIDGQFLVSQRGTLLRVREGEFALNLQRLGFGLAFLVWFAATAYPDVGLNLFGSMCLYILGQLLTGQTLPFIRLWRELRGAERSVPPT